MKQLLAAATILFITGCETTRYAYSPNAHNVPVFTSRGDTKLSASYSNNADFAQSSDQYSRNQASGYDLQGAVAVSDHVAVQGSYFSRKERNFENSFNNDSSVIRYKRSAYEFGLGYFTSINRHQRVLFQLFAGAGYGKLALTDNNRDFNGTPTSRYYNTNLLKYYIEPAIIFRNQYSFAASLSTRLSIIQFKNVSTNYTQDEKQVYRLDSLNRYSVAFIEPAFVNSYGFKKLPGMRIEYQLGLCLALAADPFFDYRPFNFSVGLVFDIPKLLKGTRGDKPNP